MDVFKIEQTIGGGVPAPDKIAPEVSFDAGSEFNLSFFDTDSNQQGFSDPGSVGSTSASAPPPPTPVPGTSGPGMLSPPPTAIKQGTGDGTTMNDNGQCQVSLRFERSFISGCLSVLSMVNLMLLGRREQAVKVIMAILLIAKHLMVHFFFIMTCTHLF